MSAEKASSDSQDVTTKSAGTPSWHEAEADAFEKQLSALSQAKKKSSPEGASLTTLGKLPDE